MISRPRIVEPEPEPVDVGTKERIGCAILAAIITVLTVAAVLVFSQMILQAGG